MRSPGDIGVVVSTLSGIFNVAELENSERQKQTQPQPEHSD